MSISIKVKNTVLIKDKLHPNNKHNTHYDFDRLCLVSPLLTSFIIENKVGNTSINFADSEAVKALNGAILKADYDIDNWNIPSGFLCPPIPGRADYIHYLSDLLTTSNKGKKVNSKHVQGLDIGTGASCIYPLLGQREYQWQFIASDIDPKSIASCQAIIDNNKSLAPFISLRLQKCSQHIFKNVIKTSDFIDFTLCNPPFHESLAQANQGSARKRRNLGTDKKTDSKLNFGGQNAELWCRGGEQAFIKNMITESKEFGHQVMWFTSLVSNKDNIKPLKKALIKAGALDIKVVDMAQGQKVSRFIAWTYFTAQQQSLWCKTRYNK
jgi:23S rRNA (adenine1618-N6)-methyltransferase